MTLNENKLLVLIDGSSYLYRAFHALPPLITSKGEPTGAVYGVINMIKKILGEYKPDYVAVVFDAKGKNFRHDMYPEYKATRPPMEDDLKIQIKPLHEVITAMGLPLLIVDGVEADDVIGTLAQEAAKKGISTLISTGDKDMAQLVGPHVSLVNTMTNTTMDAKGVKSKFGVSPEQITDYLTLVGDSSDNILGVNGVGPKTAVKWLDEYGTLENIIAHQDEIKGKVGENLRGSLGRLPLVKELVTIKDELKLEQSSDELISKAPDTQKLIELFTHLEFKSWLADLGSDKNTSQESSKPAISESKCHLILTEEDLEPWLKKIQQATSFAFDTETTGLDVMQAEIVGISFALEIGEAIYIPFAHAYDGAPSQLNRDQVLQKLRPIFTDPKKIKLGQNLKYDIGILANYGIEVCGLGYDTMLESYILNSSSNQHDKRSLVLRYLGKTITTYEDLVGKGAKQIPFEQLNLELAAPYAALDSDLVLQLHTVLWPQIEKNKSEEKVFKEIEMPLVEVLSKMERHGVCVDEKFLNNYSFELKTKLQDLESQIYKDAEAEFNINSPLQLQEILYDKLKLPILQKTPTGQPSTAEPVLQELALEYSLPKIILEYRGLNKLKSTYTDALPKQINHKTGRVHTSYNQAVTTTGRLSSTNPNLQNIPIRTEEGRRVRQAFIAPPGCKIISADYSQIELRIMAHLSQDKNLFKAFWQGDDVHRMVAAEIFGVDPEKVTDTQRRDAKTINFGLIYGMSAFGLAKRIGMSRYDAQKYIELYFDRYPGMKEYMEQMKKFAHDNGFVESIFGRRLYIPEIKAKNFARRQGAQRVAINAPIQGSAADIIKMAMIKIDHFVQKCDFKIDMIMQVHDELVFEVEDKYVDYVLEAVKNLMETVVELKVPIVVGIGVGDNWDEAH
ncbi:MAG: DNA polymerase I [Gammaproteobacteria bacterium]|nr:DNA polymerase I [Gammaproteobacteria bacterium]